MICAGWPQCGGGRASVRLKRVVARRLSVLLGMSAQSFTSNHWTTPDGVPAGGCSFGTGFCISWQNGPLGRGEDRLPHNGAFVETLLEVVADRLVYYQNSRFACDENTDALEHIGKALETLRSRTAKREARQVEGTAEV